MDRANRATLRRIAHRAMLDRGLQPDFSPAVTAEMARMLTPPAPVAGAHDLRHLGWASIDNDDSLDLDVGFRVRVQLVHTDVERDYVDFKRVGGRAGR